MNYRQSAKGEHLTTNKTDANQLTAVKYMAAFAARFTHGPRQEIAQNLSRAASAFEAEFVKPAVTESGDEVE